MAGAKRKRTNLQPPNTLAKSTAKQATRYDFNPIPPLETPPTVQRKINRNPSVKDYHPQLLFNSPTSEASPSALPTQPTAKSASQISPPALHTQRRATSSSHLSLSASATRPSHSSKRQKSSAFAHPEKPSVHPARVSQPASSGTRQPTSSSQPQQYAPPQRSPDYSPQLSPTYSPPTIPSQSPHSSEAQNSHSAIREEESEEGEEEEYSDDEGIPEPNLSQEQLEAMNSILLEPRPRKEVILDPYLLEPNSTW